MAYRANPFVRALRTYNSALYAARATTHTARAIKKYVKGRFSKPKAGTVAKVQSRIAKVQPLYANKEKYFSKGTPTGQKRRAQLASMLKNNRAVRPKRSHTLTTGTPNSIKRKPQQYPGKIELKKGMTTRQLSRRVRQYTRRKDYIGPTLKHFQGNRKMAADAIRSDRKQGVRPKFSPNRKLNYNTDGSRTMFSRAMNQYKKSFGGK